MIINLIVISNLEGAYLCSGHTYFTLISLDRTMTFLIFLFIFGFFLQNSCAKEPVIVHTQYGDILGYQTDIARVFYGIPFAQPPIGPLRFN